jgi:hypothetical protein
MRFTKWIKDFTTARGSLRQISKGIDGNAMLAATQSFDFAFNSSGPIF